MKKAFIFILVLYTQICFAQSEYVLYDNPVYNFLDRMNALQLVQNYNSFEKPKTRKEVAKYLQVVIEKEQQLDHTDVKILKDLKVEFELELFGTLNNSASLISESRYDYFTQKENYLYYYSEEAKFNFFVNLLAEGEFIYNRVISDNAKSAYPGAIGGSIRGNILNKFGFFIKGTNGNVFGDKEAALIRKDLKYNFKLNEKEEETFFDETEGYLTADFDLIKLKIGRDRRSIGYGLAKALLDDSAPLFDNFGFDIEYKFFNFSYFHGKLLGSSSVLPDSIAGSKNFIEDKFIGYHRIGFKPSPFFSFGLGEIVIYANRGIDFSYFNPFNFYKTIEHSNRDRDNSMIFLDAVNTSLKGTRLFVTLLLDDISFGKLGTHWWGNQMLLNIGIHSYNLCYTVPLDFKFEYMRIDPYVFTHRFISNNYTNFGYPLGSGLKPNSELFFSHFNYRFSHRINVAIGFLYSRHGANPVNEDGSVKKNVGGNINLGHRIIDSEETIFLDGDLEYTREISFTGYYEPYNNFIFNFNFIYSNTSSKNIKLKESFSSIVNLKIRL